jgi:hypothetical protein
MKRQRVVDLGAGLTAVVVLAACGGTVNPPDRNLAVSAVIDASGGSLVNDAGVTLVVPRDTLARPATASIAPQPGGAWDVHIDQPWTGHVEVSLPVADSDPSLAILAHKVDGQWQVESAEPVGTSLRGELTSLSWIKAIGCLAKVTPSSIARCMLEAGIKKLVLEKLTKSARDKVMETLFPSCTVVDGIIDFVKAAAFGDSPPAECSAVDGAPPTSSSTPSSRSAGGPAGNQAQLSVNLNENPFICNGVTRSLGYLGGARPGDVFSFSSTELGSLSPATAAADGRVPLRWVCQASDVGKTWHVTAHSASGASTSFSVVGKAQVKPNLPSSAPPPSKELGGVDVERYCQSGWQLHAVLRTSNAYGWRCSAEGTEDQNVSMDDACTQQYRSDARSRYRSFADAYSWICFVS